MVTYAYRIQADPVSTHEFQWDITVYVHSYGDSCEELGWRVAHTETIILANRLLSISGTWKRIATMLAK